MSSSEPSTDRIDPSATMPRHGRISPNAAAGINLQERERVRIGFDLHDGPAQTMSAALLQVKMLQVLEGEELQSGLVELRATVVAALEEIYELIERLGGRDSDDGDLVSRVRSAVDTFSGRCEIAADLGIEGDCGPVSPSMQIAVARIVQEALSNVSRHSGAHHVDIRLQLSPEEVRCEISDDGKGFSRGEPGTSRHGREPFGLHSMRERARLLDGECTVDSAPGTGTTVRVHIPVWHA